MSIVIRREPIFNAPLGVVLALGVLVAVHIVRDLLPQRIDDIVVKTLAFVPARLFHDIEGLPGGVAVRYGQLFTHALLHADYMHLALNAMWLLAGGTIVARRVGALRMLALGFASTAAGALLFAALSPAPNALVLGASGGISGLLGAATRLIHAASVSGDMGALRDRIDHLRLPSLRAALVDRQVVVSTLVFIGLNIAIAFGLGSELTASGIAWQTHVGGYLFGLLAFGLFDRARRHSDTPDIDTDTMPEARSPTLH